ncbi:MAG TPA: hypothetical protein VGD22_07270 [Sphingobacteriaceae bacterium]
MIKSTLKNRNNNHKRGATDIQNTKSDPYFMVMLRSEIVADYNDKFSDPSKRIK